jgi:putative Mg2+ transporter-C (MgtC) family protein
MIDPVDAFSRIALAGLLGTAVGFEREVHGHLAGLRTHALVGVGAALFTLVGAYGFRSGFGHASIDPTRVSAQIVSGIGFIGGGVILRDRGSVRGVTTAAALWTTAALGMAAGAGQLALALSGLLVVMSALVALRLARDHAPLGPFRPIQSIDVVYERGHGTLGPIIDAIENAGATLERLTIDDEESTRSVHLLVRARDRDGLRTRLGALGELPEVTDLVYSGRS